MRTNLQIGIERQRAVYDMPRPLLAQLAELHDISIRDFASIFDISKSYAEEILNHKKLPSLELGIRIARYYECSVEDIFGWRVEDDGKRRPLVVRMPGSENYITLKASNPRHGTMALLAEMAERIRAMLGDRRRKTDESAGEVAEGNQQGVRDVSNVATADSAGDGRLREDAAVSEG